MNPTNTRAAQIILEKLGHVPATVHEVMDKAVTLARAFFENRDLPIDPFLFPNLVRYEAKLLFETPKYRAAGYVLTVLSNNGLLLIYRPETTTYRIRVRKADEDGEFPTQNLSDGIKDFCRQPNLPMWANGEEDWEEFVCPELLKLFIIWDVNEAYGFSGCDLACTKDEFGNLAFADQIPHSVTSIQADEEFDWPEEIEDIDFRPLKKTGSDHGDDDDDENN
jgi:hypothetical protein